MTPDRAPPPHRPFGIRAVNAFGRLLGGRRPRLDEATLLEAAMKKTGLDDLGDEADYLEGLRALLRSVEDDASLHFIGRLSAQTQVINCLTGRLELIEHRKRHPEIARERVERPLFVLGLPRTGTTILYNLIAQDPAHRYPQHWELSLPCPPPEADTYASDPRIAQIDADIENLRKLVPGFDAIHPMGATLGQECLSITAYAFQSLQFELTYEVSGYMQWYVKQSMRRAYRLHRQVLQHLQSRHRKERWVLKSPAHLGHLDDLLAEYPDAMIVQTHRDPVKVLPSVSSLNYHLYCAASDHVDAARVGRQQLDLWGEFLDRAIDTRARLGAQADRFVDVQFEEILADPIGLIGRIYAHFGLELTEEARSRMEAFLADNARDKHGTHQYTPAMFGLEEGAIRERFAAYTRRFDVPPAT